MQKLTLPFGAPVDRTPSALLAVLAAAFALSGCATTTPPPAPTATAVAVDKILTEHADKVSRAWADLASLERDLAAQGVKDQDARAAIGLGRIIQPMVFQGDIEEFLSFLLSTVPGWKLSPAEGQRPGIAQLVNVKVESGTTLKDVLLDASTQVAKTAEIIVTPHMQTVRVRYIPVR